MEKLDFKKKIESINLRHHKLNVNYLSVFKFEPGFRVIVSFTLEQSKFGNKFPVSEALTDLDWTVQKIYWIFGVKMFLKIDLSVFKNSAIVLSL